MVFPVIIFVQCNVILYACVYRYQKFIYNIKYILSRWFYNKSAFDVPLPAVVRVVLVFWFRGSNGSGFPHHTSCWYNERGWINVRLVLKLFFFCFASPQFIRNSCILVDQSIFRIKSFIGVVFWTENLIGISFAKKTKQNLDPRIRDYSH